MKRMLVMLLFIASYAHADIYTWTDNKGTNHYTNSMYEIPERYRAQAKVMNLGIVEKKENSSPQQGASSQPNPPVQQSQQVHPVSPTRPPEANLPGEHHISEHQGKRMRHERSPAN